MGRRERAAARPRGAGERMDAANADLPMHLRRCIRRAPRAEERTHWPARQRSSQSPIAGLARLCSSRPQNRREWALEPAIHPRYAADAPAITPPPGASVDLTVWEE